ncbi:GntR family transcriptional regulator [Streptomyces sp. NPDC047821]|uniref:GntR family transcriptional regulator n=1 Tax=Streptomyces sp. NPDC047821 TaxID=3365488 RepID=UPI0037148BD7
MALPKYEQIAADLRGSIVRGDLKPGDAIPSERELTERWSVARATVVRALEVLRHEGLIETKQGTGSTVRERTLLARTAGERYRASVDTGHIYTAGEYAEIIAAELVPAPEYVAAALGIEPGDRVARRHRITFEGETPTATSWSWFAADVTEAAPRLLLRERIREGTTRYVEMQTGRRPHTARDAWQSRLATPNEREWLRLEDPSAVSEVHHTTWCEDGKPLVFEVGVHPSGRWSRTEEYAMNE